MLKSSSDGQAGFPSLSEILKKRTSNNQSLLDLCSENPPMQRLIQEYTSRVRQVVPVKPALRMKAEDCSLFGLLLENSLVKYMSTLGLPQVYRVWKYTKLEPGYSPQELQNAHEEGRFIELPKVRCHCSMLSVQNSWWHCCGSVSQRYGYGSESADPYNRLTDPALFVSDLQDANKIIFF